MSALLEHLDRQLVSSRRLLQVVLGQSDAIRRQDAESVLASLADVQTEMAARERLERERDELVGRAAVSLGRRPDEVDLESILTLVSPADAAEARAKSAELKGLLAEVARIHGANRVLIRQELTFLDHLMRVMSGTPPAGYSPFGQATTVQPANSLDARA
jgi:hypothetical protein